MKTKTKMRLLSLLLCFVMLVGLLPTAAFAAEKVIIDSISATVTLPTAGAHPVETGTPGDSSYDIIRIRFSKKDADSGVLTSLEPSDTFEAGATYRINVLFRAKDGFTIEREAKATINGMEAEYWSTIADGYGSQYFGLEYTVPEKITSISVTVPEPVAGEKTDTNGITINPAALSVSSAKWYINKDGVGLVSVDKFTAGKTYYLVIKYDVAEGYTVSNSAAISHDLTDGEIAHNSSNKTIMIEYTVAVQAPITYTVSFDANGGSGTMADVTGISGEYTLPACTFTPPAGKQFKCWRVDGSEKMAGDKINVAEDMVMYAVWKDTVYDRTEISTVVAESDGGNITPVYGTATDDNPVFTVITGSPAYCSTIMCGWRKHDGERYVDCEETFAADTYYYYMQVRIDGASGTTHKLDDPNLRVTVDGTEWIVHSVYVFDDVSWANVYSPAFVVTLPEGQPLTFHDSSTFDIGENYVNNTITSYSVAANVEGGTAPYTFSKVSGPAWISVSSAGDISGTPTESGSNENLVVKVTDSADAEETITIAVANTMTDPNDRTKISVVTVTSESGDITPVYGAATDDDPVFTVETGAPAYCSTIMCGWRKHDGERYVDCEETFAADTYYYYMQVRIDGASGTTHKLDDPNLHVTVDGTEWIVHSVHIFDDVSWANVYSPAFIVTKDSATTISELSATVTEPVAGYAPSLAAVAGGAGYTVEYVEWVDTAEETVLYPEDGDTFEAGKQYTVFVEFEPKDGYVFEEDASVVINEQPAEDKEVKETFAYGAITFTLAEPYLIESVKLSDVTEPSVGATPDLDITLTGETAVLSEDGEPSIFWYKYDPETDGWDDMDASTTFGAGTYMLEVWMKAEAGHKFTEGTKFFYGDEELPEFDGRMEHNYELAGEDYAGIYLYFTVDEVVRLSGASRYETGYAVADALKEALGVEKFEAVVVATGKNFADALAGSYLAVEKNAPILLTNGKDDNIAQLHTYIKENVTEGGKVYILGGEAAVPTAVEAIEGYDVVRLFGESRYDTNLAILAEAGVTGDSIIVATGKNFADSLSASAAKLPILLVKPNAALNDAQKEILAGMKNIYIVGGEGAVSEAYAAELAAYGEVTRVFGDSRYDTSVEVAKTFFGDVDKAVVASGKNFPDGLCGGPLAAALDAPLILTKDGGAGAAAGYVAENGIASGFVLGGDGALTDATVVEVFGLESAGEIR